MLEEQYKRDLEKLDMETSALIEQEKEFVLLLLSSYFAFLSNANCFI